MANPPGSFIWYELLTTDLAAAANFYEKVVGIRIAREATPGPMDYRMVETPGGLHVGGAMQSPSSARERETEQPRQFVMPEQVRHDD